MRARHLQERAGCAGATTAHTRLGPSTRTRAHHNQSSATQQPQRTTPTAQQDKESRNDRVNNKTLHPKNTRTCRLPMCAAVVCAEYCVARDMMHSYMWCLLTRQVYFTCNAKLQEGTYAKFLEPLRWLLVIHIKAPLAQHCVAGVFHATLSRLDGWDKVKGGGCAWSHSQFELPKCVVNRFTHTS